MLCWCCVVVDEAKQHGEIDHDDCYKFCYNVSLYHTQLLISDEGEKEGELVREDGERFS